MHGNAPDLCQISTVETQLWIAPQAQLQHASTSIRRCGCGCCPTSCVHHSASVDLVCSTSASASGSRVASLHSSQGGHERNREVLGKVEGVFDALVWLLDKEDEEEDEGNAHTEGVFVVLGALLYSQDLDVVAKAAGAIAKACTGSSGKHKDALGLVRGPGVTTRGFRRMQNFTFLDTSSRSPSDRSTPAQETRRSSQVDSSIYFMRSRMGRSVIGRQLLTYFERNLNDYNFLIVCVCLCACVLWLCFYLPIG